MDDAKVHEPELLNTDEGREISDALPVLRGTGKQRKALPTTKPGESFTRTTASWLSLFTVNNDAASSNDARSHTIELADAIPFYHYGHQPGPEVKALERVFVNRKRRYHVTVLPATLEDPKIKDGDKAGKSKKWAPRFPSEREELVFEAVKLLASQNAELLDGHVGVGFTLSSLRRLLKESGHEMSIVQIKDALRTMLRCTIILKDESGKNMIEEGMIKSLMFSEKGTRDLCFVQFNSFTTEAIRAGKYRGLKYKIVSRYQSVLARWLYKRMSHNFTQASSTEKYVILASTALQGACLSVGDKPNKWAKCMREALEEMKLATPDGLPCSVASYIYEAVKVGKYTKDYKFYISPSESFVKDIVQENARMKRVEFQLAHQG